MAKKKPSPVVMTKIQLVQFWNDLSVWGRNNEGWIEDETIIVNGVEWGDMEMDRLIETDMIEIRNGTIHDGPHDGDVLEDVAREWLAAQNTASLIVEVDREKLAAVIDAIEAAGGRITNKSALSGK